VGPIELLAGGGVVCLIYCLQMLRFEKWVKIACKDTDCSKLGHKLLVCR
jgi:hypothetical protein